MVDIAGVAVYKRRMRKSNLILDADLDAAITYYRQRRAEEARAPITWQHAVRELIRAGLDATESAAKGYQAQAAYGRPSVHGARDPIAL